MCSECSRLKAEEAILAREVAASVASITIRYNGAEVLERQIDALLRQSVPLREIIVVDNASTDQTSSLIAARYPQITVLRIMSNQGVGGSLATRLAYAS